MQGLYLGLIYKPYIRTSYTLLQHLMVTGYVTYLDVLVGKCLVVRTLGDVSVLNPHDVLVEPRLESVAVEVDLLVALVLHDGDDVLLRVGVQHLRRNDLVETVRLHSE